ncbi:MAG: 4-(cytidine 5'-diphospho)-2-C-methyl-D-erythritol kinase [Acidimicrobiales bacterium]
MTRVTAPAKLTVSLAIIGVRPDGYHELRAEMVCLNLADELVITEGGSGLTVTAEPGTRAESLGDQRGNLVTRALAEVGRTAAVHVLKRIPVGGGLGGGSSDAAAVLRWAGCTDVRTALALGSDVPFSVIGGRARVEGVGEFVTPLAFVRRQYLLLLPPFGVDTGRVYAAWDRRTRAGRGANELTDAALTVEPRLGPWRDALGELSGIDPVLAGSGSTWFVEETTATETTGIDGGVAGDHPSEVRVGAARARLVRVHTVPAGWEGPETPSASGDGLSGAERG